MSWINETNVSDLDYNRDTWDRIAQRGDEYYCTANEIEIQRARRGQLAIKLTPTKNVPATWLGNLVGKDVLALAAGGGLQGPLLAAARANTTVFDLSEDQLKRDRAVASKFGLALETVRGDMADLASFADHSFDLVINPCSLCFCRDPKPVWQEVTRVLRPGGVLLSGLINPVNYLFDFFAAEDRRLVVRYQIPFSASQLDNELRERWLGTERPIEWGHSLQQMIGDQLDCGLVLTGFYEDRWGDEDLLSEHLPVFLATRTVKK